MKYTKELGRKLLELLPEDVVAVACDKNGAIAFYFKIPTKKFCIWSAASGGNSNFAGCTAAIYDCDDWENSLVVRGEKEKWVPKEDDRVYYPAFDYDNNIYSWDVFSDDNSGLVSMLNLGILFPTKDEAIACAKKMLAAVGGGE